MARGRPSRQTIYNQLDEAIEDLRSRMGGLPSPAEAEEIWDDLWHQEAHPGSQGGALRGDGAGLERGAAPPCDGKRDSWQLAPA